MTKEEYEAKIESLEPIVEKIWQEGFNKACKGEIQTPAEYYDKFQEIKEYNRLVREYKLIADYELEPIGCGDLFTLEDFIDNCKEGGFMDSDGFGNYSTKDKVSTIEICPSDVIAGIYRKDFPYVVWYNK